MLKLFRMYQIAGNCPTEKRKTQQTGKFDPEKKKRKKNCISNNRTHTLTHSLTIIHKHTFSLIRTVSDHQFCLIVSIDFFTFVVFFTRFRYHHCNFDFFPFFSSLHRRRWPCSVGTDVAVAGFRTDFLFFFFVVCFIFTSPCLVFVLRSLYGFDVSFHLFTMHLVLEASTGTGTQYFIMYFHFRFSIGYRRTLSILQHSMASSVEIAIEQTISQFFLFCFRYVEG